ncbi:MAG: hypothetical protein LBF44_00420 [Holosporaceae bacterium]|jgi:hypothetical protein|nr:hypothetical protein [Holosporaceae bacterium]
MEDKEAIKEAAEVIEDIEEHNRYSINEEKLQKADKIVENKVIPAVYKNWDVRRNTRRSEGVNKGEVCFYQKCDPLVCFLPD